MCAVECINNVHVYVTCMYCRDQKKFSGLLMFHLVSVPSLFSCNMALRCVLFHSYSLRSTLYRGQQRAVQAQGESESV